MGIQGCHIVKQGRCTRNRAMGYSLFHKSKGILTRDSPNQMVLASMLTCMIVLIKKSLKGTQQGDNILYLFFWISPLCHLELSLVFCLEWDMYLAVGMINISQSLNQSSTEAWGFGTAVNGLVSMKDISDDDYAKSCSFQVEISMSCTLRALCDVHSLQSCHTWSAWISSTCDSPTVTQGALLTVLYSSTTCCKSRNFHPHNFGKNRREPFGRVMILSSWSCKFELALITSIQNVQKQRSNDHEIHQFTCKPQQAKKTLPPAMLAQCRTCSCIQHLLH